MQLEKKTFITYLIISAIPFGLYLIIESVQSIIQRFTGPFVHILGVGFVLLSLLSIINALLAWLAHSKLEGMKKVFLVIMVALGLVAGFILAAHVTTTEGNWFWPAALIPAAIVDGAVIYWLYPKLFGKKIFLFMSPIVFLGLFVIGLPFAALGYVNRFMCSWFPLLLAIGVVVVILWTIYRIHFPKPQPQANNDRKPKRYGKPRPSSSYDEDDISSVASRLASSASSYFGSGLSNVYPQGVDYSYSGNTITLTFRYKCKRGQYMYTPSDGDIRAAAIKAARYAESDISSSFNVRAEAYCEDTYWEN